MQSDLLASTSQDEDDKSGGSCCRKGRERGFIYPDNDAFRRPVSIVRFLKSEEWGMVLGLSPPISKGLILAQNERWRRGLGMQVERAARPVAQG